MELQNEQIAPEIIQTIIVQATANGLSMKDYLARLLGLTLQRNDQLSLAQVRGAVRKALTTFYFSQARP
jgi:hypothetical protein